MIGCMQHICRAANTSVNQCLQPNRASSPSFRLWRNAPTHITSNSHSHTRGIFSLSPGPSKPSRVKRASIIAKLFVSIHSKNWRTSGSSRSHQHTAPNRFTRCDTHKPSNFNLGLEVDQKERKQKSIHLPVSPWLTDISVVILIMISGPIRRLLASQ